jgi:hypothetical protein
VVLARRLLLLCAVLLAASALAAALVPPPEKAAPQPSPPSAREPGVVEGTLTTDVARHDPIQVARGDLLRLTVTSGQVQAIEIDGLDLVEAVDPMAPAHFEILADAPGIYPVQVAGSGRTIGTIRVTA